MILLYIYFFNSTLSIELTSFMLGYFALIEQSKLLIIDSVQPTFERFIANVMQELGLNNQLPFRSLVRLS